MATRTNTTLDPLAEKLRSVHTIPELVQYLHDELNWPVNVEDWEENLFDWQPDELNLKAEHEVKIKSIKQLRPLVSGQPWGIFFVEFAKGHLPITVLRRVLNGLVPKGRATGGGHQTWAVHDLLFVSSFGESNAREIALAHFTDESAQGDLPTLRVLGWDDDDTPMQLEYVAQTLRDKLRWPVNTRTADDLAKWRAQWSSAFSLGYGQVINDSKTLSLAMAELAKRIRRRVNTVLALESDSGHLRQMHKAFKENLIADLSDDAFADMFAQTITYGLFTARASRISGALVADNIADMVPSTNPFLKELLGSFLNAAGRARNSAKRVDFDELGINEVVTVLREVPMDAVLRSFNASKPGDDPVIHFYEDFLKAYDKAMRAKRGVFYTPSPVVQFIVRSVDEILKTEFEIEDGLASTITWGEMLARKTELKLPLFCTSATPFVQVLDPATGTGTFIVEVISQIHAHMLDKWAKQGKVTRAQWQPLWVAYVKQHLLPRLYAFELMMAPYAIAHMKIGLKLAETGYTFPEDGPRVNVFLTNALEPAHAINPELAFEAPMLAHEAGAANRVKEQLAATVVVGNPPYSGVSNNKFPWIDGLLKGQLPDGTIVKSYYQVDGKPLGEKKLWLQDDYVKFIRFGQWRIDQAGLGVLGFITNQGYLDNPTFRGMRQAVISSFPSVKILDLYEPSNVEDENVFEIKIGVAVGILSTAREFAGVGYQKLSGKLLEKSVSLLSNRIKYFEISPRSPNYFLKKRQEFGAATYEGYFSIDDIYSVGSTGVITAWDDVAIGFDSASLKRSLEDLYKDNSRLGAKQLERFANIKKLVAVSELGQIICPITYRPFDNRAIAKNDAFVWRMKNEVSKHLIGSQNLSLISARSNKNEVMDHFFVTREISEAKTGESSTQSKFFPVWLIDSANRQPNLSKSFLAALQSALSLKPADHLPEYLAAALNAEKIFHYIYAVLHSPAYRQRYAAFLRTDFPRIPIPGTRRVFDALAHLGAELVAWHLLEHPDAAAIDVSQKAPAGAVEWFGRDFALNKIAEKSRALAEITVTDEKVGKVYVNSTSGFANVDETIWLHTIGGYQVLHKWLDDRRKAGRSLSQDDITHWLRVYASLEATQKLMSQVDVVIEANGGWPGAFSQNHPPPDAATLAAEQSAQKEQLKALKKATSATKNKTASASPTGATSLFDFDDDLDGLAAASGAPPRPKFRATPAKAAGGKASGSAELLNGFNDGQVMCAIRSVLASAGSDGLSRDGLIRSTSRILGHPRTSAALKAKLDSDVRRAVRRGISENSGGVLTVFVKDLNGYDREHLKAQLLAVVRTLGGTCAKADVPTLLARYLGFARTGSGISATVNSLVRSLARSKKVELRAGQLRIVRAGEDV